MDSNFTTRKGSSVATCINHAFFGGSVTVGAHELLSTTSTHLALFSTVQLKHLHVGTSSWRRFRWRTLAIEDRDTVSLVLDVVWGFLALTPAHPSVYIAVLHLIAGDAMAAPLSREATLSRLRRKEPPFSLEDVRQLCAREKEVLAHREVVLRAENLQGVDIVRATKPSLKLSGPAMAPFTGILPTRDGVIDSPAERRAEVSRQLGSTQEDRHVPIDLQLVRSCILLD